jgi:hypothetical protein
VVPALFWVRYTTKRGRAIRKVQDLLLHLEQLEHNAWDIAPSDPILYRYVGRFPRRPAVIPLGLGSYPLASPSDRSAADPGMKPVCLTLHGNRFNDAMRMSGLSQELSLATPLQQASSVSVSVSPSSFPFLELVGARNRRGDDKRFLFDKTAVLPDGNCVWWPPSACTGTSGK